MIRINDVSLSCLGRNLVLTELRPPAPEDLPEEALEDPIFDKNQWFTPIGDYLVDPKMLEGYTPYSLNFNLDASDNKLYYTHLEHSIVNGRIKTIESQILKCKDDQYCYMVTLIMKWIARFQASLRTLAGKHYSTIGNYGIFFEMTQRGIIHGHGVMYINNSYADQVSQLMTMAWVKIANVKFCAQQKMSYSGKINRTFSKCNSIDHWVKYITKEQKHKIYLELIRKNKEYYSDLYKYKLRLELIDFNF